MRRLVLLLVLGIAGLVPATAGAETHAHAALVKVKHLQQGKGVKTGYEMSPALAQLAAALPSMTGDDRIQAESILARPDDTQADPQNTHKWSPSATPGTPYCTAHFCVHFVLNTADASTPAYAKQMGDILEGQVYPCENGTDPTPCAGGPGLGWRDPAPDGPLGGDDRVDVYIEDLFTTERVFGYVAVDPDQPREASVPHHAYMVLDKDYTRYTADQSAASGLAAEQVTAAHEYNHVLQNAYDYLEDSWMFEATAVYMEDKVFPSSNDYLNYVKDWVANTKQPMTQFGGGNLKAYGSAVWNHWLDHRFGAAAVRSSWEQSVGIGDFAPNAYGASIASFGGGGFADEFDRFSAAVAEWDVPSTGFPDTYPDVGRDGTLPVGTQTAPFGLPHTTFALFDVPIPPDAPTVIRVVATLPSGTAGAVALVGRTGPDVTSGEVTTALTPMPTGGTAAANLDDPTRFGRITAVVVNSDPSQGGFDSTADDYIFTKDAPGVVASMAEPGAPIPTTGDAGLISDHGAFVAGSVDPHLLDTNWSIEYGRTTAYGSTTIVQKMPGSTVGAVNVVLPIHNLKANATYHFRVIATNSVGAAAGVDHTFKTLRDVTKPTVTVKVKRQRIARVRKGGVLYLARCSERCLGTAEVTVSRRVAHRLGLPTRLARARIVLPARVKSSTLRVALRRKLKRRLLSMNASFPVTLRVHVADESHNAVTLRRRFRLLRS